MEGSEPLPRVERWILCHWEVRSYLVCGEWVDGFGPGLPSDLRLDPPDSHTAGGSTELIWLWLITQGKDHMLMVMRICKRYI